MTPESPGFAAAVRVARRALAERIAARDSEERRTSIDTGAVTVTDAAPITVQRATPPPVSPPKSKSKGRPRNRRVMRFMARTALTLVAVLLAVLSRRLAIHRRRFDFDRRMRLLV
jgi:hypothetical protein